MQVNSDILRGLVRVEAAARLTLIEPENAEFKQKLTDNISELDDLRDSYHILKAKMGEDARFL